MNNDEQTLNGMRSDLNALMKALGLKQAEINVGIREKTEEDMREEYRQMFSTAGTKRIIKRNANR